MSELRVTSIQIKNYRSFGEEQTFVFPSEEYKKPVAIVGYNNSGKTNLMNCILYGIGEKYVSKDSFSLNDFHNRKITNIPQFNLYAKSSIERKYDGKQAILDGCHKLNIQMDGEIIEGAKVESFKIDGSLNYQAFGASRYFNIFYINFHCIKDEISTQKTSWGNLKSFLAKHIKKLVDEDSEMQAKQTVFEAETKDATNKVLEGSKLTRFISDIKRNYSTNLRNNKCDITFGLPSYEDIFLQMIFKVGLNYNEEITELLPISHFGDGYISMFVMAVIQAIAESSSNDKCLFLFEEPESFLHENHQDYFYKMVLCNLTERGHQVIYTTHSDRMVDIFDTKGIIRIEFNEINKQTEKRYNNVNTFSPEIEISAENAQNIIRLEHYNSFIKSIEPNLNKILFSRKVLLVEGPNDILCYKYAIENKIKSIKNDARYAETYLSFLNIAIIAHHGKSTALLLVQLCKHIGLDYFLINDWDFNADFVNELSLFQDVDELKRSNLYLTDEGINRSAIVKGMITTNWNLIISAGRSKIHFNVPKLESVLGYSSNDKSSIGLWETLKKITSFESNFFPPQLEAFLEFDKIQSNDDVNTAQIIANDNINDSLPF